MVLTMRGELQNRFEKGNSDNPSLCEPGWCDPSRSGPGGYDTLRCLSRRLAHRLALILIPALLFLPAAAPIHALSCTTQGSMQAADRDALTAAATPLATAIAAQNYDLLQASLLPAVIADWDGIHAVAQQASTLAKGGQISWRSFYLLDASELKGPQDAEFYCTTADSSLTISIGLRSLPPGRYGLILGDFTGAPLAGQLAFLLGRDSTQNATQSAPWKLGGIFAREGALEGHDGVWYWTQARMLATKNTAQKNADWSAWFSYDAARWLLVPVDFLSSPNLEKLDREQEQLKVVPTETFPFTVTAAASESPTAPPAGKMWNVSSISLDTTLHTADLAITYDGSGLADPVAARQEAVAVMSAVLRLHPDLRDNFHGLWAYADKDGKRSYALELAMRDIP